MRILLFETNQNQVFLDLDVRVSDEVLSGTIRKYQDLKPLQKHIGYIMRRGFAERFAQGGPGWVPDAESTIAAKSGADLPPKSKRGRTFPRLNNPMTGTNPAGSVLIATGALRDSYVQKFHPNHVSQVQETEDGFICIEGSKDPKAEFHQQGTAPYIITPVKAKSLRFVGAGGSVIFRKIVNHPGLPARPVMLMEREQKQIDRAVEEFFHGDSPPTPSG